MRSRRTATRDEPGGRARPDGSRGLGLVSGRASLGDAQQVDLPHRHGWPPNHPRPRQIDLERQRRAARSGHDRARAGGPTERVHGAAPVVALVGSVHVHRHHGGHEHDRQRGGAGQPPAAGGGRPEPASHDDRERQPQADHVARVEVVEADGRQQADGADPGDADRAGDQRAARLSRPRPPERERGAREHERVRPPRPPPARPAPYRPKPTRNCLGSWTMRSPKLPGIERLRLRADVGGDRQQGEADRDRQRERRQHPPRRAQRDQQPHRLGADHEDREVVRGDGERADQRPEREPPAARLVQHAREEEQRERREQREQRVRPRLLREPHQQRTGGGQRRHHQRRARAGQAPRGGEGGGHHRGPGQGRQRPQPELAGAEQLRPQPREHVVERRVALDVGHAREHVPKGRLHQHDGGGLVVPVALLGERREAQQRGGKRQAADDPRDRGQARADSTLAVAACPTRPGRGLGESREAASLARRNGLRHAGKGYRRPRAPGEPVTLPPHDPVRAGLAARGRPRGGARRGRARRGRAARRPARRGGAGALALSRRPRRARLGGARSGAGRRRRVRPRRAHPARPVRGTSGPLGRRRP